MDNEQGSPDLVVGPEELIDPVVAEASATAEDSAPTWTPDPRSGWPMSDAGAPAGQSEGGATAQGANLQVRRHPIVRALAWLIGLVALGVLALIYATGHIAVANHGPGYAEGAAIGSLGGAVGIGLVVTFLITRFRRSRGRPSLDWAWSMPIAAILVLVALALPSNSAGAAPPAGPRATPPPAQAYDHITSPYVLQPPTSNEAALVANIQGQIGKGGFTDANVVVIVGPDKRVAGYLIVLVNPGAVGAGSHVLAGLLGSLNQQSLAPTSASIDGRTVSSFSKNGVWSAVWVDGNFVVDVVTADQSSASAIAKAVMDAQ